MGDSRSCGWLVVWAAMLAACNDAPTAAAPPVAAPIVTNRASAQLVLVPQHPRIGDLVTVALTVPADSPVAAWKGELSWAEPGLTLEGLTADSAGLHAFNPAAGRVRGAGAAVRGFAPQLFSARFRVQSLAALSALRFRFDELKDLTNRDLLARVAPSRFAKVAP